MTIANPVTLPLSGYTAQHVRLSVEGADAKCGGERWGDGPLVINTVRGQPRRQGVLLVSQGQRAHGRQLSLSSRRPGRQRPRRHPSKLRLRAGRRNERHPIRCRQF